MKLLVTGGCGFLGSNLVADALRRGVEVTVHEDVVAQPARFAERVERHDARAEEQNIHIDCARIL